MNRERAEGNEVAANLSVTSDAFVGALAEHVFGWRATPDRFVKSGRNWIPRWRFNPLKNLDDAFALLDRAGGTYELCFEEDGTFRASVRISNRLGTAAGEFKARIITFALARALGFEVPS